MKLYLIRHARQDSTLCNVDVPLAKEGEKQADLLGQRLAKYQPDAVYSSNLIRAVQTAKIVLSHLNEVPYQMREGIKEIDFGCLTGNSDAYNLEHFGDFLAKRKQMEEDLPFPEGECGEEVFERAKIVLDEIIKLPYEKVVIVTHGGTIRSILSGILSMPQSKKLLFSSSLENCSITELNYDKKYNRFTLERFNDYSHLEGYPELLRDGWKR